jgi:hypothetical protein
VRVGTRSVLYGAHQFALHPWFVALAWWKLYGFPWDPRLWVAFFVHDIGYVGKPNMDGPEGEAHVFAGAKVMGRFDRRGWAGDHDLIARAFEALFGRCVDRTGTLTWYCFSFYHSRFMAKRYGAPFSRLCVADKLAIALTPAWLYLPMVRATGEIDEYMRHADDRNLVVDGQRGGKYSSMRTRTTEGELTWYSDVQDYLRRWVEEHRDMRPDTWTPGPQDAA